MDALELRQRTRQFAIDIIRTVRLFPRTLDAQIVGRQLIRSATSTAANYRSACRSKSPDDFVSKISTVCEESDETQLWLDLALAVPIHRDAATERLFKEATELVRIFSASRATAKANQLRRRARGLSYDRNGSRVRSAPRA